MVAATANIAPDAPTTITFGFAISKNSTLPAMPPMKYIFKNSYSPTSPSRYVPKKKSAIMLNNMWLTPSCMKMLVINVHGSPMKEQGLMAKFWKNHPGDINVRMNITKFAIMRFSTAPKPNKLNLI